MSVRHIAAGGLLVIGVLVPALPALADPFTVTTVVLIDGYSGPVGAPIYGPEGADPAAGRSFFTNGTVDVYVGPQSPYPGYDGPEFAGSGTGTATFTGGWSTVTFGNESALLGEDPNTLAFSGTTTTDVSIGELFHIATISFTNGDWFSSSPQFDAGYGPLYPESLFSFRVIATTDPLSGVEHVWTDTLVLESTRLAGTPDNLYLKNHPLLGGIAIAEGTTGTAEVWGRLGSLEPVEFRNFTGGATAVQAVPEPSTLLLIGLGLPMVARRVRRAAKKERV